MSSVTSAAGDRYVVKPDPVKILLVGDNNSISDELKYLGRQAGSRYETAQSNLTTSMLPLMQYPGCDRQSCSQIS